MLTFLYSKFSCHTWRQILAIETLTICAATLCLNGNCTFVSQLQNKFEHLKRLHLEERMKLDEMKRLLEEEIVAFSKKKATSEIYSQTYLPSNSSLRKDKDRKK